ncbi:MAG: CPBP family intramembrane metalloprotease [Anaerolineales bacterium]|nr:CPBP family intramembrane metalloprotease [Anaerolineales bacterium]
MGTNSFEWKNAPQFSVGKLLLATFIPSGVAYAGFHFILPGLVAGGMPIMVAWPAIASLMLLGLVIFTLVVLKRESLSMGITLVERLCMKRLPWKEWLLAIAVLVGVVLIVMLVQGLMPGWMQLTGFEVPEYMPFFLNPSINASTAEMSVISPGLPLTGRYELLPLLAVALFLNIVTEELYFRAWMMPKMARFGAWSWVLNGVLFAFYHTFQLWLLPILLAGSLGFAFLFYRIRSVWPPFVGHFIVNFLLSLVGILALIIR